MMNLQPVWLTSTSPQWAPEGLDPFVSHRTESWEWHVLARDHAPIGTLDGVEDGSIEYSTGNTIRGGGSLTWEGSKADEPNWDQIYLQPWYTLTTPDGREVSWPRGVFIPGAAPTGYSDGGRSLDVELYDKLLILDQDKFVQTYSVNSGRNVVAEVRKIIEDAGQSHHNIEDSDETLRSPMVWEPGTTRLRVINDLLEAINYFALWADGYGTYQGLPYREPSARPTIRAFIDDENGIYAPDFTHDRDTFNVPNRVVAIGRGDGDDEAVFVGVAENTDPESPTSYQSRGRWIVHVEEDVEATSQAVIDSIVNRRLGELTQTSSVVEFDHAHVPLELNDIIEFRYSDEVHVRAAVQSFSISTTPGDLMGSRVREVVS